MADLLVQSGGSVYLLRSITPAGSAWIAEHIPDDATRFGGAVAVERASVHRRHRRGCPARWAPRPMTALDYASVAGIVLAGAVL